MEFLNIGTFGHVDHGKSTLTTALTGKVTDTFSEEIKRGITIKLGHAQFYIYEKDGKYYNYPVENGKIVKGVSIIDAPGHESLLSIAISGLALLDGAILVIAANQPCPQPQTKEHLMILDKLGIKNILIVQSKVDAVSKQQAMKNYEEIKQFVKGTVAENSPIIPVSSTQKLNLEYILEYLANITGIEKKFKFKNLALIVRSFDINLPGTKVKDLKGGVLGGAVVSGEFKIGDEIEIKPGIDTENGYKPLKTKISSLKREDEDLEIARKGGLVGFGTFLDPTICRRDILAGNFVSTDPLPDPQNIFKLKVEYIKRDDIPNMEFFQDQILLINHLTISTQAVVKQVKKDIITVQTKKGIIPIEDKVAILRKVDNKWRFAAIGKFV